MEKEPGTSPGITIFSDDSPNVDAQIAAQNPTIENIVSNFDFSEGINSWSGNSASCRAYVVYNEISYIRGIKPYSGDTYAILTQRTDPFQSLEQDITDKITPDTEYIVSAYVRVSGKLHDSTEVRAMLKLVNINNLTKYHCIARISSSNENWVKIEGSFSLQKVPRRVVFYLEGPPPGIDLLVDSVIISYKIKPGAINSSTTGLDNIILNHDFSDGIRPWRPILCHAYVASVWSGFLGHVKGRFGDNCAIVTKRTQHWQGLEQDITNKVKIGVKYSVFAHVRVDGPIINEQVEVKAMIRLENFDSTRDYITVERVVAGKHKWEKLEGSFTINTSTKCAVFYLEGPPPGIDLLVDMVKIF